MESIVTQAGLILLALAVIGFLAFRAWTDGVLGMLWAITGIASGLATGYFVFKMVDDVFGPIMEHGHVPFIGRVILAIFTGLIVYVIVRVIAKKVLSFIFDPDGALGGLAEGLGGALLSLIPSAFTLVILFTCLRMAATIQEFNLVDKLSTRSGETVYTAVTYPSWPALTKVRDSLEGIPLVVTVLDPVDPVSRPSERRLAIIVMIARDTFLLSRFRDDPETREIFASPEITAVIENPSLAKLATERKYFDLLTDPLIRETAKNKALMAQVGKLDLERHFREFILHDEVKRGAIIR